MKKIMCWVQCLGLVFCLLGMGSSLWAHEVSPSTDALTMEVLNQVNQYRASRGLSALRISAAASRQARLHSSEMARHVVGFGHEGFNQRVTHLHHDIQDVQAAAENVAYNYKTAKIVVDGWIHSPLHHRNIIGAYDLTGIGIVRDRAGKLYYTQLFVRTNEHEHGHTARHLHAHSRFFIG